MADLQFVPAQPEHVEQVAVGLRADDLAELQAAQGADVDVRQALQRSVAASLGALAAVSDGRAVALLGVAPVSLLGDAACPWLLGTDGVLRHRRAFMAAGRISVAEWGQRWPVLFNFVDARNVRSIGWLQRLGFTIAPAQPFGVQGLPFHRFERCT